MLYLCKLSYCVLGYGMLNSVYATSMWLSYCMLCLFIPYFVCGCVFYFVYYVSYPFPWEPGVLIGVASLFFWIEENWPPPYP